MTQDEKVKHWIKIADNDIVVAATMLKTKQNLNEDSAILDRR